MATYRFVLASIFFLIISCKKEPIQNNAPDKGILYDNAHFGTKINIGGGNYTFVYWGRNADEIFVSVGTQYSGSESYQVDLLTKKSSRIDLAEGFVKGRNFDNSSMVMLGRMNNVYGYYLYHFNTGTYSLLLKVEKMRDPLVNVSGSAVFYNNGGDTTCPLSSGSCADWSPGAYFHFIDVNSKKIVPLPGKYFQFFSKTGKRTILGSGSADSIYIFDNDKAMLVDSLKVDHWVTYYDDETGQLKAVSTGNANEVTIINARTKDIIQKFKPGLVDIPGGFTWSPDGTRLYYYWHYLNQSTVGSAGIYDLISKKETILDQIGNIFFKMYPSTDNRKLLYYREGGSRDWYIKKVQ